MGPGEMKLAPNEVKRWWKGKVMLWSPATSQHQKRCASARDQKKHCPPEILGDDHVHCCSCCAPAPAALLPALLHVHLLAPGLACSLATPREHWRQQPIKGRGLLHMHNLQIKKATSRSWRRVALYAQAISLILLAPNLACSLWPHQGHIGDSNLSKAVACFTCTTCSSRKQHHGAITELASELQLRCVETAQ